MMPTPVRAAGLRLRTRLCFRFFLPILSLWAAGVHPALSQSDPSCSTQAVNRSARSIPYPTGPLLPDGLGWTQPEYYSTLQNADVDGDGQNDIVARDKDGLHVWQYRNGAWVQTSRLTALSDSNGWNQASQYSTIQFGHLQAGSKQADLIARASDGIHVWRYNASTQTWRELGATIAQRPFATPAAGATSTNWNAPAYYNDIFVGDLNHDGVVELLGRGKNGLETYSWNEGSRSWEPVVSSSALADEGEPASSPHFTPQFVTLSDKTSYLVAYHADGIELLKPQDGGFHTISAGGPFQSQVAAPASSVLSIRTYVDGQGSLWLYGLTPDSTGEDARIAVYQWNDAAKQWGRPEFIALPSDGWDRPAQYLTLRAGDFYGDGAMEITARGADGMHIFRQHGRRGEAGPHRWRQTQLLTDMRDAAGYSLASSYYTIQTLNMQKAAAADQPAGTLLVGRSPRGVEIYHNVNGRLTQATPFPTFANANQTKAFMQLGNDVTQSNSVRSLYAVALDNYDYWHDNLNNLSSHKTAENGIDQKDWDVAYNEIYKEIAYVVAVHAWFQNNNTLVGYIFGQGGLQLPEVSDNMSLSSSGGGSDSSVTLYWSAFAANILSQIAGALPIPGAGLVTGLISDALSIASTETSGNNSNALTEEASQIASTLLTNNNNYTVETATQLTSYVSDWGLLQSIGAPSNDPKSAYVWGQLGAKALANAKVAGALGQRLWIYQTLSNAAWHVWHCDPREFPPDLCPAKSSYPSKYIYYTPSNVDPYSYDGFYTAYVTIHSGNNFNYPYFPGLDELTGLLKVDINDVLTACNGWHTDDAALSSYQDPSVGVPGHCAPTSSALLVGSVPETLAALKTLRERIRSDGATSPKLDPPLNAAIQEIRKRSTWGPGYTNSEPTTTEVKFEQSISPSRYVDKTEPIQFLQQFVTTVQLEEREGHLTRALGDSYAAEAYEILGRINDDEISVAVVGAPYN